MKNTNHKLWAIIPARSGSRSVKDKNIKNLDGVPLLVHTIRSAKKSRCFEKILLLTDSNKYAKIGSKYGAEIPFIRPKSISLDNSTDNELYVYFLNFLLKKNIKFPNFLAHLSPTVPFRFNNIINKGIKHFFKMKKFSSTMRSVSQMSQPSYKTMRIINNKLCSILKKDFDLNKLNSPRQSYQKTYIPNGLIDILNTNFILKTGNTHGKSVIPYVTDQVYIDIDTEFDFKIAESLIQTIKNKKLLKL